jgi:hypothetical protein
LPLISEFFGIKIYLYWEDHIPPHFHAIYGEHQVIVDIENAVVLKGAFPVRQLKLVLAWCELHREELKKNWESAKNHGEIEKIEPLQ